MSRGRLKPANRTFNACNHEYEITFSSETQIEEVSDVYENHCQLICYDTSIEALQ